MNEYAKGNALDLGARRSGIGTALKRFYEYSARLSDTTTDAQQAKKLNRMILQQAENVLANGCIFWKMAVRLKAVSRITGCFLLQ